MPRRSEESNALLEDLLGFFLDVPWWVGPPVILITWLFFGVLLPVLFSAATDGSVPGPELFTKVLTVIAVVMAVLVAVVWGMSLVGKLFRR